MDLGLAGKSVIVTGGGSNIGRAIVLGYAEEGAHITVGDIDAEQTGRVAEQARTAGAASVQVLPTDVTDLEQVRGLVDAAVAQHGTVDVLVNCVGWDKPMYFTQTTPEFWQQVIQINYLGVLNCTKIVLDIMIEKQKGCIVSISSDASRQGEPREAVYGGIKAAINSFMKTIAKENGRFGIRCNAVCPGLTIPQTDEEVGHTSMWANKDSMFTEEQIEKVIQALPLRKITQPRDVANAVLFLSSEDVAGDITGQILSVSSGYSMIG